jgi:hypothetical protein
LEKDVRKRIVGRVADQQLVKIERPLEVIIGRQREPAGIRAFDKAYGLCSAGLDIEKPVDVAGPQASLAQPARELGNRHRQPDHCCRLAARAAAGVPACDRCASAPAHY